MKIERTPRRQFAAAVRHQKLYASINTLADIGIRRTSPALFDHLVGLYKEVTWHFEAKRFGGG